MGLLAPIGLLLGLLAVPIILFYMLRLRRQEITVSSSMLWRQAVQDRQANAPWQRLRRNLLLYLQLLVLALLVLALARPFVAGVLQPAGNVVVILDGSASMQARDGADAGSGLTRFARAQVEAAALADNLAAGARLTLILAGPAPATVLSNAGDPATIRAAIRGLHPGNGAGDLAGAVILAAAAVSRPDSTLIVISDGAIGDTTLPAVNAAVRYIPVGHSGENTAITALALRDAPQGPQLFVGLANLGRQPASGDLAVEVDGRLWDSRPIHLDPGAEPQLTLPDLPLDTRLVTATLTTPDLLPLDNQAWAVRAPAGAAATLLVSAGNSFAEKALLLLPQIHLARAAPADYRPGPGYDLTVFDSYLPASLPPGNLLLINPPGSPLLPVSGTITAPVVGLVETADPLLRYVNLSGVHIAAARRAAVPPWARALVRTTAGDPLLIAGETGGRRVAALLFDLHRSDLALQVAFPILMANLAGWLAPGTALELPPRLAPGAAVALHPQPEADRVVVAAPAGPDSPGRETSLSVRPDLSFADTGQPGLYIVRQFAGNRPVGAPEAFAVNLLDRTESAIAPRAVLPLPGHPLPGGSAATSPAEVAPLLLALAILLLGLEWWLYHHGGSAALRRLRLRPRRG